MPPRHPLAPAQIIQQQDQQQRRNGRGQKGKVEPANQTEIGIAGIGLVDLPFQRQHPHPVQPGAGIALAKRREGEVRRRRIGEMKGIIGSAPPVRLPGNRIGPVCRVFFDQHRDGGALFAHLGNAEADSGHRQRKGQRQPHDRGPVAQHEARLTDDGSDHG